MALLSQAQVGSAGSALRRASRRWLILLVFLTAGVPLSAQIVAGEPDVKAAYIKSFAHFVVWPAGSLAPNATFAVGIIGDDSVASALDAMVRGRLVDGRPIAIRRLHWDEDPGEAQILFISASEESHLMVILSRTGAAATLTVSDLDRFSLRGGMIELKMVGNHLRFDINWANARAARLKVSAKLLNVARAVVGPMPVER